MPEQSGMRKHRPAPPTTGVPRPQRPANKRTGGRARAAQVKASPGRGTISFRNIEKREGWK